MQTVLALFPVSHPPTDAAAGSAVDSTGDFLLSFEEGGGGSEEAGTPESDPALDGAVPATVPAVSLAAWTGVAVDPAAIGAGESDWSVTLGEVEGTDGNAEVAAERLPRFGLVAGVPDVPAGAPETVAHWSAGRERLSGGAALLSLSVIEPLAAPGFGTGRGSGTGAETGMASTSGSGVALRPAFGVPSGETAAAIQTLPPRVPLTEGDDPKAPVAGLGSVFALATDLAPTTPDQPYPQPEAPTEKPRYGANWAAAGAVRSVPRGETHARPDRTEANAPPEAAGIANGPTASVRELPPVPGPPERSSEGADQPEVAASPRLVTSETQEDLPDNAAKSAAPSDAASPPSQPEAIEESSHPQGPVPGFWERFFSGLQAPTATGPAGLGLSGPASGPPPLLPPPAALASMAPQTPPIIGTTLGVVDRGDAAESGQDQPVAGPRIAAPDLPGPTKPVADILRLPHLPELAPAHGVEEERLDDAALAALPAGATVAPGAATASAVPASATLPVPQVAAQITGALARGADGATELALSPDELGHVRLRLEPDPGNPDRMVVMITFERPETLDLFRRHAGELAEALRAAGYAGADIGFGQQGSGGSGTDRHPGFSGPAGMHLPQPDASGATQPALRLSAGASLDLRL